MTMGKVMFTGNSTKQKLNITSSTKTKIVAVHDTLPSVLWTSYFLAEQGCPPKLAIINHDNQSSILLETNSKASRSKCTWNWNIGYFFGRLHEVRTCRDPLLSHWQHGGRLFYEASYWRKILAIPQHYHELWPWWARSSYSFKCWHLPRIRTEYLLWAHTRWIQNITFCGLKGVCWRSAQKPLDEVNRNEYQSPLLK